jgi:hypothetical protein
MREYHKMHPWLERLRESWVVRFWVVRGANLLLVFLILLVVIFGREMDWLRTVVTVLIPVVGVVVLINLVASLSDLIGMFKK